MQAQVYEGYFENGTFFTSGRTLRIPELRRVYLTVFEEPIGEKHDTWAQLDKLVSTMEVKPRFEDFPRCQLGRSPISFDEVRQ
jgi:hypothetical protein